jgi:hypothetical protein
MTVLMHLFDFCHWGIKISEKCNDAYKVLCTPIKGICAIRAWVRAAKTIHLNAAVACNHQIIASNTPSSQGEYKFAKRVTEGESKPK